MSAGDTGATAIKKSGKIAKDVATKVAKTVGNVAKQAAEKGKGAGMAQ